MILPWLVAISSLAGAESGEHVYSVCELLATPHEFNQRIIRVRGIVEGGMEGAWLRDESCPGRFRVGERSLAMAIWLSYQSEYGSPPPRHKAHIDQVERQITAGQRKRTSGLLELTYTGVFETRSEWKLLARRPGETQLWGFGHQNGFPAQLVITDEADPVIGPAGKERK